MMYSIAGGTVMGFAQLNESQLERITRQIKAGARKVIDFFTNPLQEYPCSHQ